MIQRREEGGARLAEHALATSPYLAGSSCADLMEALPPALAAQAGRAWRPAEHARLCRARGQAAAYGRANAIAGANATAPI